MEVDAAWISAFAAVLAVIIASVRVIIAQKYRRLQFLVSSFSLIDFKRASKDKIQIYYDENIVSNLSMVKVKVKNSGKRAIQKKDVVKPIEIVFNEKTKIIDWNIATTKPPGININLERLDDENKIKCNFDLLNPGAEADLELICIPDGGSIPKFEMGIVELKRVDVKIEGVEKPSDEPIFYTKLTPTRILSTLFGLFILIYVAGAVEWAWKYPGAIMSLLIMCIIAITLLILGLKPDYLNKKVKFKIDDYTYKVLVIMLILFYFILFGFML